MSLTNWELRETMPIQGDKLQYANRGSKTLCFTFFNINILEYLRQFIEDYKILYVCKFGFYIDYCKIYLVT